MMIASRPDQPNRLRGWRPLIIAAAIYALAVAGIVIVRTAGVRADDDYDTVRAKTTSDFRDFWWTARHFRQTGEITTQFGVHNYPPFFTIFMLPWSFLPLPVASVLFSLLSLGLAAVTVVLVESLFSDSVPARPRTALLITIGLILAYVHSCVVLGNVGLLLLFLVVTTWFLVERGREWEAGVALGLATLIKLLPGLLIVFFLLRQRWRVAGAAAVIMVVLGYGLPLATLGQKETVAQYTGFYERAVRGHSAYQTIMSDQPAKAFYGNNSLPIVLRRLLSPTNAGDTPDGPLRVNVADLPRWAILSLYAFLILALVGMSVAVTFRGPRRWPPQSLDEGRALRAQFGVWCCLMLLASPLVWAHYLPLAYWPLAFIADRAERSKRATRRAGRLNVSALVAWLVGAVLLAWPAARAAGAQIAAVTWLWLVLLIRARERGNVRT